MALRSRKNRPRAATQSRFCLVCRADRVFEHVQRIDWRCSSCGSVRSFTMDPVSNSNRGGDWARFWGNVKVTQFCWPWISPTRSRHGPRFSYKGVSMRASRVAYYLYCGYWPDGVVVRTCHNKLCMKPDHFRVMLQSAVPVYLSSIGRAAAPHELRKRCKRGHRMEGTNVAVWRGKRCCRICRNAGNRKRWRARQDAKLRGTQYGQQTKELPQVRDAAQSGQGD